MTVIKLSDPSPGLARVTDLNCVSTVPSEVKIQSGQRSFQQIMVAGRRTPCVYVSAWVYVGVTY